MNSTLMCAGERIAVVGQSGGPTSAINASLAGVIDTCRRNGYKKLYGMINGIQGFMEDRLVDLFYNFPEDYSKKDPADISMGTLDELIRTPSMYLGSCRFKLPEPTDSTFYQEIFSRFEKLGITDFFYIGGNDSMDTVDKLSRYGKEINSPISFIGIPKTIDNDLMGTDHSPGFGSAARFVAESVRNISYDARSYNLESVTIVEIMGRNAGWLTAASILAGERPGLSVFSYNNAPDLIYLSEVPFDKKDFLEDIKKVLEKQKTVVVAVSEGIRNKEGVCIDEEFAYSNKDSFGHVRHSGVGKVLEQFVSDNLHIKVRSVELNVLQRCMASQTSITDLTEANKCGKCAVESALSGCSGIMIGIKRQSNDPYEVTYEKVDISTVPNLERSVPLSMIDLEKHTVNEKMVAYLKPLI